MVRNSSMVGRRQSEYPAQLRLSQYFPASIQSSAENDCDFCHIKECTGSVNVDCGGGAASEASLEPASETSPPEPPLLLPLLLLPPLPSGVAGFVPQDAVKKGKTTKADRKTFRQRMMRACHKRWREVNTARNRRHGTTFAGRNTCPFVHFSHQPP
jgi:hypothetical protein